MAKHLVVPVYRRTGEPTDAQFRAGNYRKRPIPWMGLTIAIENEAGSVRSGTGPGGVRWETRMVFPYGYVKGTEGVDGDEVDIIIGPQLETAPMVYIVHQRRAGDWAKYDEDKSLAGFMSEDEARAAFLANYDDPRFLGPITAMPVDEFVRKVRATAERPAMIKAVLFIKSRVPTHLRHLPSGKVVVVTAYSDRRVKRGQADLFGDPPAAAEKKDGTGGYLTESDVRAAAARAAAPPEPPYLHASQEEYERGLWQVMNARWDAGRDIVFGTQTKAWSVGPKNRAVMRLTGDKIEMYEGRRAGKERWIRLGPIGQAIDSLAGGLGLPTSFDRAMAQPMSEVPPDEPDVMTDEQARFQVARMLDMLGPDEDRAIDVLTPESLGESLAAWQEDNPGDALFEAAVKRLRPDLFANPIIIVRT